VLPLLGAQGFGAAVGNIICPHNVVAAAATVGLAGREGRVLRRTIPVSLAYVTAALAGVIFLLIEVFKAVTRVGTRTRTTVRQPVDPDQDPSLHGPHRDTSARR
jgi:L-lactate permease